MVLERVDPIAIDVVPRDRVLIGKDQRVPDRKDRAVPHVRHELFERFEISSRLGAFAFPPEVGILLELRRPDEAVGLALRDRDVLYRRKVGPGLSRFVAPLDVPNGCAALGGGAKALVSEDVPRVVEHDVEDHEQAQRVRLVDKGAQLFLRFLRRRRESWLRLEEVLDPVAMKAVAVGLSILQHGRQPDCARTEVLDVAQPFPDAVERSALVLTERFVVRHADRRLAVGSVESIEHQEVDPAIPPILRRWKRRAKRESVRPDNNRAGCGLCRLGEGGTNRIVFQRQHHLHTPG